MGQSIGIGSVSAISGLKCIGIGSVVNKWYQCITISYYHGNCNACSVKGRECNGDYLCDAIHASI